MTWNPRNHGQFCPRRSSFLVAFLKVGSQYKPEA